MDNELEIWKDVVGYEGRYQVSNLGRVRNSDHHILKPFRTSKGYLKIKFGRGGKSFRIHRLVMLCFVGPSPLEVNHKNFIKEDNRLENLEYVTGEMNIKHYQDSLKVTR